MGDRPNAARVIVAIQIRDWRICKHALGKTAVFEQSPAKHRVFVFRKAMSCWQDQRAPVRVEDPQCAAFAALAPRALIFKISTKSENAIAK